MTAAHGEPRHVDEVVLGQLVDHLGAAHVGELRELFLADARDRLHAVRTACEAGDADGAARSAHRLKSASGFLGAIGVATLCRKIEHLARNDRLDEIRACVALIPDELEHAAAELATLIGHRSGPH